MLNIEKPVRFNRLLGALPPEDYERLSPSLETLHVVPKYTLFEPNTPIEHVYFPNYGVASLLAVMEDGSLIEVGTVGNEGMVGIPVFLGATQTNGKSFYQIAGEAVRMPSAVLRAEVERGGGLVRILQRYTQALFSMLAQHTACNRLHNIEQRCARWLLMSHDRVGSDSFELTHEFLSQMLGVRRAGVSTVMATFQAREFVHYKRGIITIVNRAGLEATTCECYAIVNHEYRRMLDGLF